MLLLPYCLIDPVLNPLGFKNLSLVHIGTDKKVKDESENGNEIQNQKPSPDRLGFASLEKHDNDGKNQVKPDQVMPPEYKYSF